MWQGITPSPDSGFIKNLKKFDPKLKCQFSRKLGLFVITQSNRLHSGESVAGIIEGDDGAGYRQPDNRDIQALREADFEFKDHKKRILEGEEYMLKYRKDEEAKNRETIRDATKDDKYQSRNSLMKAYNMGKGMSPYRQVAPKPQGKVFKMSWDTK